MSFEVRNKGKFRVTSNELAINKVLDRRGRGDLYISCRPADGKHVTLAGIGPLLEAELAPLLGAIVSNVTLRTRGKHYCEISLTLLLASQIGDDVDDDDDA